jgi:hypothetical protein
MNLKPLSAACFSKALVFTAGQHAAIYLYFGWSWLELDALRFSRAQFGIQLGYFEGIWEVSQKRLNLRKYLWDAG